MDQQTYYNLQDRDEGNRRESEGVMAGLDWAKDIIEQRVNRPGKGETRPAPARESLDQIKGFELEEEKEGEVPIEAHMEDDNRPCPQANQGETLYESPCAGIVEELLEGTQEDPQALGRVLPKGL